MPRKGLSIAVPAVPAVVKMAAVVTAADTVTHRSAVVAAMPVAVTATLAAPWIVVAKLVGPPMPQARVGAEWALALQVATAEQPAPPFVEEQALAALRATPQCTALARGQRSVGRKNNAFLAGQLTQSGRPYPEKDRCSANPKTKEQKQG